MSNQHIHFCSYWNPTAEFDPLAPKGMKLWTRILNKQYEKGRPEEVFAWFGKLSYTGNLWIDPSRIPELNRKIRTNNAEGRETHLYLYSSPPGPTRFDLPNTLHVANVKELVDQDGVDIGQDAHVPKDFYLSQIHASKDNRRRYENKEFIPFFWKITDIRELPLKEADNLEKQRKNSSEVMKFDFSHKESPAIAYEKEPREYFGEKDRQESGWTKGYWEEVIINSGHLDPDEFSNKRMLTLYSKALKYAKLSLPVLLVGETGTGKQYMARFIRRHSRFSSSLRPQEEMFICACGDYEDPVRLEKALFGAGESDDESGLIKAADGDTLIVTEIDRAPHHLQRRLFQTAELRGYYPAGSQTLIHCDFRLILTTDRDIEHLHKSVDPYLLDKIDLVIRLPRLNELEEDLPTLWRMQFEKAKNELAKGVELLSWDNDKEEELLKSLAGLALPGNFHDLRRIAVMVVGDLVDPQSRFAPKHRFFPRLLIREALAWRQPGQGYARDQTKMLARCFADEEKLDTMVELYKPLDLVNIINSLQIEVRAFAAREMRRIAWETEQKLADICSTPGNSALSKWKDAAESKRKAAHRSQADKSQPDETIE